MPFDVRPRSRMLSPTLGIDRELYQLEQTTGLPIRLAYTLLACFADREGRFPWEPEALRIRMMPYDELDFSTVLEALRKEGKIERYEANGEIVGVMLNFHKHQHPNAHERPSRLPPPPKAIANRQYGKKRKKRPIEDTGKVGETREERKGGRKALQNMVNDLAAKKAMPEGTTT